MSYYEDFDEEQRKDFESDPFMTGVDNCRGDGFVLLSMVVIAITLICLI